MKVLLAIIPPLLFSLCFAGQKTCEEKNIHFPDITPEAPEDSLYHSTEIKHTEKNTLYGNESHLFYNKNMAADVSSKQSNFLLSTDFLFITYYSLGSGYSWKIKKNRFQLTSLLSYYRDQPRKLDYLGFKVGFHYTWGKHFLVTAGVNYMMGFSLQNPEFDPNNNRFDYDLYMGLAYADLGVSYGIENWEFLGIASFIFYSLRKNEHLYLDQTKEVSEFTFLVRPTIKILYNLNFTKQ